MRVKNIIHAHGGGGIQKYIIVLVDVVCDTVCLHIMEPEKTKTESTEFNFSS